MNQIKYEKLTDSSVFLGVFFCFFFVVVVVFLFVFFFVFFRNYENAQL